MRIMDKPRIMAKCPDCGARGEAGFTPETFMKIRNTLNECAWRCPHCNSEQVELLVDLWEVEFDETEFWTIDEADKPFIAKIVGTYLFDRNERTFLCSSTPAYWLQCVGQYVRLVEGLDPEANDYQGEHIRDKYENQASMKDADGYYECRDVDNLPATQLHHHTDIEATDFEEALDELDGQTWF